MSAGALDKLKKKLTTAPKSLSVDLSQGLSSGSTLLNLALTGCPAVGFLPGYYYRFVGDSNSGKTFICLSTLAEASINPKFDKYQLIYDGPEAGALMNVRKYYGAKFAERVVLGGSTTVEEFYFNLDDAFANKRSFVYILDSMDVLSSQSEMKTFQESKNRYRKGLIAKGSYGDGKAPKNNRGLRPIIPNLQKTGSILIVISQSADDFRSFSTGKTATGGRSLNYYATARIWTSQRGRLFKSIRDNKVPIGIICKFHVERTRVTGRDRTIEIPIYPQFGVDNTGSCVDFLVKWNKWKQSSGGISTENFGKLHREELISKIEGENREKELELTVAETWDEIEEACSIERKFRYGV